MAKLEIKVKRFKSSIDWNYRPSSYFWAKSSGVFLTSDIKGASRRKYYERLLEIGDEEAINDFILRSALMEGERRAAGSVHPSFMGGEYLPDCEPKQVEIARIGIASTTNDVTCIYATAQDAGIFYTIVDEYGGETIDGPSTFFSDNPLSLEQLVNFFLKGWDLFCVLNANFEDYGNPEEMVKGFVTDASSSFYAQFGLAIDSRIDDWLVDHEVKSEEDDFDDENEEN